MSSSVASSPGKSTVFLGRADKPFSALLADIRRTILKNRIRIRTFFEDQDKLRKGVITRSQFHRGLTSSGNKLSDSELATLCQRFAASTGVDGHSNPLVRWVDFATDIDSVFTISGLDTNPEVDVVETLRRIRGVGYEPEQLPQINDDDNEKLAVFLGDFATEVAKKNVDLFPPFEDFDEDFSDDEHWLAAVALSNAETENPPKRAKRDKRDRRAADEAEEMVVLPSGAALSKARLAAYGV